MDSDNAKVVDPNYRDGLQVLLRATVDPTSLPVLFLLPPTVREWECLAVL